MCAAVQCANGLSTRYSFSAASWLPSGLHEHHKPSDVDDQYKPHVSTPDVPVAVAQDASEVLVCKSMGPSAGGPHHSPRAGAAVRKRPEDAASVAAEEHASAPPWLQKLSPREDIESLLQTRMAEIKERNARRNSLDSEHLGELEETLKRMGVWERASHGIGRGRHMGVRDTLEGKGPRRRPQERLDRRLEGVVEAVGGSYCRLPMPLKLALGVRGTVAGHRLGALEGGGYLAAFQCIPDRGTLVCCAGRDEAGPLTEMMGLDGGQGNGRMAPHRGR